MLFVTASKKDYLIHSRIKITSFPRGYWSPKISKRKKKKKKEGCPHFHITPHAQSRSAYDKAYKGSCRIPGKINSSI